MHLYSWLILTTQRHTPPFNSISLFLFLFFRHKNWCSNNDLTLPHYQLFFCTISKVQQFVQWETIITWMEMRQLSWRPMSALKGDLIEVHFFTFLFCNLQAKQYTTNCLLSWKSSSFWKEDSFCCASLLQRILHITGRGRQEGQIHCQKLPPLKVYPFSSITKVIRLFWSIMVNNSPISEAFK